MKALELLAWVHTYPNSALNWARRWPLIERLYAQLYATLDPDTYETHWALGNALPLENIASFLHEEFRVL